MVEDDQQHPENDEQEQQIVLPSHAPFPPPPEVNYTRPNLGPGGVVSPGASSGENRPSQDEPRNVERTGAGMAASFAFLSYLLVGIALGALIDKYWNHSRTPWGMMVMTLAATGVGFYNIVRILGRSDRKK